MLLFDTKKVLFSTLKRLLPEYPIIVEAGAFDGNDTIIFAHLWPKGSIYAFEPVTQIYQQLIKNIQHLSNVHPFQLALADTDGSALFYPSEHPKKSGVPSQAGSLLPPKERLHWSNISFTDPIDVQTIILDSWARQHQIKQIDLLWLDVQGYELPIMQASPFVLQHTQYIFTEVHFIEAYDGQEQYEQIKAWLEQRGFNMIGKDFKDTTSWFFGNALFKRKT